MMIIVYATNADRINKLIGKEDKKPSAQVSADASEDGGDGESSDQVIYGDQIGDNLSGFLTDEDFFDETEQIPTVVVIERSSSGTGAFGGAGDNGVLQEGGTDDVTSGGTSGENMLKSYEGSSEPVGDDGIVGNGTDAAGSAGEAMTGDGTASPDGATDAMQGTGMAVVGQLINPNPDAQAQPGAGQLPADGGQLTTEGTAQAGAQDQSATADSSGYLTTVPQTPPGGFGEYIPPNETIGGTPVGNVP